ncbi:hypothetical protein FB451DRAFT_1430751 [Mycena latifolia]|nr:hypothetical protein FB451DRAFT_1430751 [Mycena latifolia]
MFSISLAISACVLAAGATPSTRAAAAKHPNPNLVAYPSILNVLPEPFDRPSFITNLFYQTTLPDNAPPEFAAAYATLKNASYISFDPRFATEVIGNAGPIEKVAEAEDGSQEMPMYLKDEGVIFWNGNDLAQFRTINVETFEVKNYTTSVPVPNAAAGTIHKGQIYMGNFGDTSVHGGIWRFDFKTGNATMILNNQLGLSIGADDMTADDRGGIFFTDTPSRVVRPHEPHDAVPTGALLSPPEHHVAHRRRPDPPGPNGVVLSPDGKELYVNDNGDTSDDPNEVFAQVLVAGKLGSQVFINSAGARTIYAYALSPTTGLPTSRRTVAVAEAGFVDGMKVTSSGLIFVAVYGGVDVYDPDGTRLGRINIPDASPNGKAEEKHVVNLVFVGNDLWCFAYGGVYRIPGLLVTGDPRLN